MNELLETESPPAVCPPSLEEKAALLEAAVERARAGLRSHQDRLLHLRGAVERMELSVSALRHKADALDGLLERPAPLRPSTAAPRIRAPGAIVGRFPARRMAGLLAALIAIASAQPVPLHEPRPESFEKPRYAGAMEKLLSLREKEDESDAALALVYAFKFPGREETVLERLGFSGDGFIDPSPWTVTRIDRDSYRVTYQPPQAGQPEYEFEADVAAQTVRMDPAVERLLASRD